MRNKTDLKELTFGETKISTQMVYNNADIKVMQLALSKGQELKTHTSPTDGLIVVLEGEIIYFEAEDKVTLKQYNTFPIKANVPHSVIAFENSRMLLIR